MNHYTAILFDLDGTLRFHRPSEIEIYVTILAERGICLSSEQVRAGQRWAHAYWADAPRVKNDMARGSEETFWLNYTRQQVHMLGAHNLDDESAEDIHAAFQTRYTPEGYLHPSAHRVLADLLTRGYILGLLSNRSKPLSTHVAELGLGAYFSFTLASGEVDAWKPDPRIFWLACQKGMCEPAASVYVGDNYYADVVGAQAAGLTPVLYDPDDIFPEVNCRRITDLCELLEWLA